MQTVQSYNFSLFILTFVKFHMKRMQSCCEIIHTGRKCKKNEGRIVGNFPFLEYFLCGKDRIRKMNTGGYTHVSI